MSWLSHQAGMESAYRAQAYIAAHAEPLVQYTTLRRSMAPHARPPARTALYAPCDDDKQLAERTSS